MTLLGCRKPYEPHIITSNTSYLVVDGAINVGPDSTIVRLSRTVPLTSYNGSKPEEGAIVMIMSDAGNSYPLTETGNGYYKTSGLNLSASNKYGLKIMTSDGKIYQSDLIDTKNSPPIDSVYYRIQNDGVQVYADTHDPANNTRYYRWEFVGTYEFHSAYNSVDVVSKVPFDTVVRRELADQIFVCWQNDHSTNILLNTSAKLSQDVITKNPITFIASTSEKIANRYSILVRQYALTTDAYNYFAQLKKNTEQLGGIFDPQPSTLHGNIHCVSNPTEQVIGYVTAGNSSEARIFISNRNLPHWQSDNSYTGCMLDTDLFERPIGGNQVVNEVQLYIYPGYHTPIFTYEPPTATHILGYVASDPYCVDCTIRGGTSKKPSFWISE